MEKVLILTCSTGEGHNSAARAVETALKNKQIACEIKDPVSFQSERMTKLVAGLYNDTIRKAPRVFGAVYKMGDLYASSKLPSPVYWANAHYARALKEYILSKGFDCVICTHLYGMEAMTAIRKDPEFKVPCYGVLTDYVSIPFLDETALTGFFVPTEDTKMHLVSKGTPEDSVVVSGIPVDAKFTDHPDRETARAQLGIPADKHLFLIMTGGAGCENMEKLCARMADSLTEQDMVIVFTGKNQELKNRLEARFGQDGRLQALGFTDQVAVYMAAADVLLSKPGGLSSTEAAVANIPLVHIHGIPGCETYNARFFADHGMSCNAENDEEAVAFARGLAYNHETAEKMRAMQRTYVNPRAAERIVREVM